jgi:hypothetical protein
METENINSGWIEKNVVLYPVSSYLTNKMHGSFVVTGSSPLANSFKVSFDGGEKQFVDYNKYVILGYPLVTSCNAQFVRDVTFNSSNQTVTYKITATECSKCEEERLTENFVLVPKFPSNYNVVYDISRVQLP